VTFFLDANVLIYSAVRSDYRDPCLKILAAIAAGDAPGRTSTAVLEETWYIELSGRAGPLDGLTERLFTILSPLLPVTDEAFRLALALEVPALGTNDRLHAGTCLANGIDTIVSADRAFDRLGGLRRIDPLDSEALRGLLQASQ
jgi:predicted nucleic acid-binding protein